jgi:hypothetical protein
MNIEKVLESYIVTALWCSKDEDDNDLDEHYNQNDIHPDTIARMRKNVTDFCKLYENELLTWEGSTTIEDQTGCDLWLNRNHHGAGFWEDEWGVVGKTLSDAAHKLGECHLYVGDDGYIHCS